MGPSRMEGDTAPKCRGSRRDGAEGCTGIEIRPLTGVLIVAYWRGSFSAGQAALADERFGRTAFGSSSDLAGTTCPNGPDTPVGVANGTVLVAQRRSRKLRI